MQRRSGVRARLGYVWEGLVERLRNRSEIPFPPRRMREFVGPFRSVRTYRVAGEDFLVFLQELCGLGRGSAVLDIGCGCGQIAAPLTAFLDPSGSYVGFDIAADLIGWCEKHITSRHPRFRFAHANLYNKRYNTETTVRASEYTFPTADAAMDVAFAKSVFTHLLPDDTTRYVSEVARVMKPTGHALLTFFLLNDESHGGLSEGRSQLSFEPQEDGTWIIDPNVPEAAVAYDEASVRELIASQGLRIVEPVRYGYWCGRTEFYQSSFQDLVIVTPAQ